MTPHQDFETREALIRELYEAFNRREIDRVLAAMHPDVLWPNGWEGGHVRGQAEVREYWQRQWAAIDPIVTPTAIAEEPDGRVRVTVDSVVRDRAGRVLSHGKVAHLYRFENGLVRDMEIEVSST